MPKLFHEDRRNEAVERTELCLVAEVEALKHVVSERRHLAVLPAEQLLKGGRCIRVRLLGLRQLGQKPIDAHEHAGALLGPLIRNYGGLPCRPAARADQL